MAGALSILLACAVLRIVIFGLDRRDMRHGQSTPLQVTALVVSIGAAALPLLAIRFGWVERNAATVIIAAVAFFYFGMLKRQRFFHRPRPPAAQR